MILVVCYEVNIYVHDKAGRMKCDLYQGGNMVIYRYLDNKMGGGNSLQQNLVFRFDAHDNSLPQISNTNIGKLNQKKGVKAK